jgi:phosphocarrier protein
MIRKTLVPQNPQGIEPQTATHFVQTASQYASTIWIEQGSKRVNAKSLMGVLSLRIKPGDEFQLVAQGEDERQAINALIALVQGKVRG